MPGVRDSVGAQMSLTDGHGDPAPNQPASRRTANGERRTANGERRTANGERRTANGERRIVQQAALIYPSKCRSGKPKADLAPNG